MSLTRTIWRLTCSQQTFTGLHLQRSWRQATFSNRFLDVHVADYETPLQSLTSALLPDNTSGSGPSCQETAAGLADVGTDCDQAGQHHTSGGEHPAVRNQSSTCRTAAPGCSAKPSAAEQRIARDHCSQYAHQAGQHNQVGDCNERPQPFQGQCIPLHTGMCCPCCSRQAANEQPAPCLIHIVRARMVSKILWQPVEVF